jgi:hypothetical protein
VGRDQVPKLIGTVGESYEGPPARRRRAFGSCSLEAGYAVQTTYARIDQVLPLATNADPVTDQVPAALG